MRHDAARQIAAPIILTMRQRQQTQGIRDSWCATEQDGQPYLPILIGGLKVWKGADNGLRQEFHFSFRQFQWNKDAPTTT
jgi:hypothetical protein